MVHTSRYRVVATMGMVLSLASCADTDFIMRPPAPEPLPSVEAPPPELTESVINVPVQLDLSALLQAVNDPHVIPKKFDHWSSVIKPAKGGEYRYYAERDDFAIEEPGFGHGGSVDQGSSPHDRSLRDWWKGVEPTGSSLVMRASLRYKIGLRPHAVGDTPGECGDGPDWPRHAALTGNIALTMTPQYSVAASVRGIIVNPMDPCRLRIADMDVQEAVNTTLSDQVKRGFNTAVSRLNALSVKLRVEDVWTALRNPIQLLRFA